MKRADPEAVRRGLELMSQGHSPRSAAEALAREGLTVSHMTLSRRRKKAAADKSRPPARKARKPRKKASAKKPSKKTTARSKAKARKSSFDDFDALVGEAQDFEALDELVVMLEDKLAAMDPGAGGTAGLVNALVSAIGKRARLRPSPPPDPELAREEARRRDGLTRKKLLRYVLEHEHLAKLRGECTHCGSKLSQEKLKELYG